MYKLWICALLMATCFACKNNTTPTNCPSVHNGTFVFNAKFKTGEILPFTIYRNDSVQIEVANNSTDSTVFAVQWVNDCQYDLLLLKSSFGLAADVLNMSKSIPLQTTINYIGKDFYMFTAERKANDFVLTDTMRIVEAK
jgi:hypothetical protein